MSLTATFLVTLAFLLAPWVIMPRARGGETAGLVRILWWLNVF